VAPVWAEHLRLLIRSSIASLISLGIELLLVQVFDLLHVEPVASFVIVQILGTLMTFAGNKYWAFEASRTGRTVTEGSRAIVVFGGSFVLNTGLSSFGSYVLHAPPVLAFLGSQAVVWLGWNYPMNRWWVFRDGEHAEPPFNSSSSLPSS
jgi:putative flippase GtrA